MSAKETVRVDRAWKRQKKRFPAGLLCFHPRPREDAMRYFVLGPGVVELGRADACAIHFDDDELSRRHARFEKAEGTWRVVDLDSANGVFVDGERVESAALEGGEMIRVGTHLLRFFAAGLAAKSSELPIVCEGMVGGPALEAARKVLTKAASSELSVLVMGETGTGKELAARLVHDAGPRREGPFVPVNCGAIPAEIVESELFGHVKGAFTGATNDSIGLVRQASGGTLFLDELGELPLESQAKLLRLLQEREVRPVGGSKATKVDLRVVCATNRNLPELVQQAKFRPDLFARVAELVVDLPTLDERVEDIPLLVEHFVALEGADKEVPVETLEHLCLQRWPFNIRQLQSGVRRALLLAEDEDELSPEHFAEPRTTRAFEAQESASEDAAAELEASTPAAADDVPAAKRLRELLEAHRGDVDAVAEAMGLSRSQVYRRAKRYGINVTDFRV